MGYTNIMLKRAFNLAKKERYKEAEAVLQKILAKNPTWMAWDMLGIVLDKTQRHGKAMEAFQQANKLSKNQPEVIYNMEFCALNLHQYQLACECFRSLIDKRPNDFALWTNLGAAEKALGNYAEALKAFERVCDLKPDFASGWANRATVLAGMGTLEKPEAFYRRATELDPKQGSKLAWFLISEGRYDEAEEFIGEGSQGCTAKAKILERCGDLEGALETLKVALPHAKTDIQVTLIFARVCRLLKRPQEGLPLLKAFLQNQQTAASQASIMFEMGHCLDSMGQYAAAFKTFKIANTVENKPFNMEQYAESIEEGDAWSPGVRSKGSGSGLILIFGIPRSGTSLCEQILGRHPLVTPCGERNNLTTIAQDLHKLHWPRGTQDKINKLSQRYLEGLPSGRVTDKMPENSLHLNLIHHLIPDATLVHCVRDPRDSLLSCFTQHFDSARLSWSCTLGGLSAYHRLWKKITGKRTLFEIATQPENTIRGLLDHCALDFHPDCLTPHESNRNINTASYAQVKEPIHNRSIGRWRNYETQLGSLLEELKIT